MENVCLLSAAVESPEAGASQAAARGPRRARRGRAGLGPRALAPAFLHGRQRGQNHDSSGIL